MRNLHICLVALSLCVACAGPSDPPSEDPRPELRTLVAELGLAPIQPPPADVLSDKIELGRALFFDPIMAGNKDFACSGCHRMDHATADGVSLPVGTKAYTNDNGERLPGERQGFVPRNVPDLFNRGQAEVTTMFWDTRMMTLEDARFVIYDFQDAYAPLNFLRDMTSLPPLAGSLDNILAAQNMMPVLNRDELRGIQNDRTVFDESNELAGIADHDLESVWVLAMRRYEAIPAYVEFFERAYPGTKFEDMDFTYVANAISAFIIDSFTLTNSPWDRFLAGDDDALTPAAARGAVLFYGEAMCSSCHLGSTMTDQKLYNIAVPPLGRGPDKQEFVDRGAAHRAVASKEQNFGFRTPPLRNVALTGPYMHNGVYDSLEDVVRHKNNALYSLRNYDASNLTTYFQGQLHRSDEVLSMVEENVESVFTSPLNLSDAQVQDLVAFLESLTDPAAADLTEHIPATVPSGLDPIVVD